VTDIKDQFARLLADEPDAPNDLERIVVAGRRARRRRTAALAVAGTAGAAGLTAAVVVPVLASGGGEPSISLGTQPSPTPSTSASAGKCYLISAPPKAAKLTLQRFIRSGKVGEHATINQLRAQKNGRTILEVCAEGASAQQPNDDTSAPPAGPPYHYTEQPDAIASRLAAHLHNRVTHWSLDISYSRPFAQESASLDKGHPTYYDGNVDVHETQGYGDIGVQVMHETTEQVAFTGDCTADENCAETTLADGSVLRTGQVKAGPGDTVVTAEVHRPDGTVVQAQMSNYPFGPEAGTQAHGEQPLSLDQLVSLAEDEHFTF
jgi:hypothetical protein